MQTKIVRQDRGFGLYVDVEVPVEEPEDKEIFDGDYYHDESVHRQIARESEEL